MRDPLNHGIAPPARKAPACADNARAAALIDRYITTGWTGENTIAAMIAFWQLSRSRPALRALFGRFLETRQRVVSAAIRRLANDAGLQRDTDEVATCLILMTDGVWLQMSLSATELPPGQVLCLCEPWLAARLAVAAPAP